MQKIGTALVFIILGLIVLAFPMLGLISASVITGFIVLLLGIGFILAGVMEMGESKALGILELILGIIALVLGIGFIFNPGLFSWVAGFIVWIVGLFLIIAGIVNVFTKTDKGRWNGVIAIIIGIIYVIVGTLIKDPMILGILIGLWLLITGIIMLLVKE